MKTYKVLKPLTLDGTEHAVDATVELNEGKAEHWVKDGSLEEVA